MSKRGFTLVELLVVIILIAVLASIAIPKFSNSTLASKEASLRANLKLIRQAADAAEADTGLIVRVTALTQSTAPASGWKRGSANTTWSVVSVDPSTWKGPYLDAVPYNPFSRNNTFTPANTNNPDLAWTKESRQSFNPSPFYYPSTEVGSNGIPYRQW